MLQHIIILRNQKKGERFIYRRTDERQFYGEQNSNSVLIGKFLRKSKKAK